jgi:small conductance mechanosensitive channel
MSIGPYAAGLWLAIVIAMCAPETAHATTTDTRAMVVAQLALPSAAPVPAMPGLSVSGAYVSAPITLDGATLFRIGAPLDPRLTQVPIATRVDDIQATIAQLVALDTTGRHTTTVFDPASLRVHLVHAGDAVVLEAVDADHPDPLPIVTVTHNDANANDESSNALAAQWQSTLQSALVRALDLRQPAVEKHNAQTVARIAIVLIAISSIVLVFQRTLRKHMERLEREVVELSRAEATPSSTASEQPASRQVQRADFIASLRSLGPAQRLSLYGSVAEALMWALCMAWLLAVTWSLSRFADTTPLAHTISHRAFDVIATVVGTLLLNRLLDIVIDRGAVAWRFRGRGSADHRARFLLRIPTIARALAGAKAFTLLFVGGLTVFGQLGVPIGSVVTIGGLAAIALSLAAQNFVRDFLNGYLVLYEDQYVVGDYVTINAFSGNVEVLTLRMVQIRDAAGDLITIPHSSVVNVINQSRNWSRIDYHVPIDPGADVPKAIGIVRAQIEALAREGDWVYGVGPPIEWIGIDALSRDAVVIRVSIKTAPLRQFELRRQINERVCAAFVQGGVAFGAPTTP